MLLLVKGRLRARVLLLSFVAATSHIAYIGLWTDHQSSVFYLMPFRLWELMGGALVIIAYRRWGCSLAPVCRCLLKYGFWCTLLALLFLDVLPENIATLLCVLVSWAVLYLSGGDSKPSPVLANPATVFIGQVSYSIYLWHWPVIVFSKLILSPSVVSPIYLLLTMGLSLLSYYLIERSLRYCKWNWFREQFFDNFSILRRSCGYRHRDPVDRKTSTISWAEADAGGSVS